MTTVTTTHGDMDEGALVKSEGDCENDTEHIQWTEYRLPGSDEIVHRSVHVTLKQPLSTEALAALFAN